MITNVNATVANIAAVLNGRAYGNELHPDEEAIAEDKGLVIVFGYSDDNCELRGAIHDELGCYNRGKWKIGRAGVLPKFEQVRDGDEQDLRAYFTAEKKSKNTLKAFWEKDGYSWTYEIDCPFATFDIMEDGEKYCRGIVFAIADLELADLN